MHIFHCGGKMMKKLQNIAAIFAAGALLLGAASCSHDGGASLAALGKEEGKKDPPTPVTVNAVWDLASGANASNNAAIKAFANTNKALDSNEVITPDSGSGATLTIIANQYNKIKYNGGIQQSSGSTERDFAELKVDGACTVKIKAKGASTKLDDDSSSTNINSFSINGENKFKVELATKFDADEHEYTYTATAAETIKITAIGMKFTSIACSQ